MAKRDYVKDLNAVKQLNAELQKSSELFQNLNDSGKKLGTELAVVAKTHEQSGKYSKENVNMAKQQSKVAKGILGVLKAEDKGSKLGLVAAKAKLKFTNLFTKGNDKVSKDLMGQYKSRQKGLSLGKRLHKNMMKQKMTSEQIKAKIEGMGSAFGEAGSVIVSAITNPLTGVIGILKLFSGKTDAIGKKFGALGVTEFRSELGAAHDKFKEFNLEGEDAYKSVDILSKNFGMSTDNAIEASIAVGDLAASTGTSVEDSAKLVGFFSEMTDSSAESAANLLKSAESLAVANGVAPGVVLKDIAANTETFAKFGSGGAEGLMRAAIQARKLGISLKTVEGTADSLLNFQDSLNAEIEAGIMLGRQVNLQKAREAALSGDLESLQKEILNVVGDEAEWNKLNVLQRQSLAKAVGMSIQDLDKMVRKQDEQTDLAGELGEQDLENLTPQEAMSEMTNTMKQIEAIFNRLVEDLGPHLEKIFTKMAPIVENMAKWFGDLVDWIDESIGLGNAMKGILAAMAIKSLATAIASIYASLAQIPLGVGLLGAAAIVYAMKSAMPAGDFDDPAGGKATYTTQEGSKFAFSKNDDVLAAPGLSAAVGGMGATRSQLNQQNATMAQISQELRKFRKNQELQLSQHDQAWGVGGRVVNKLGSKIGETVVEAAG